MTLLQALILGIVQGATEFLPISSSGHLVLVPWVLGWTLEPDTAFVFDVLVQWGTLVAVVFSFRTDLARLTRGLLHGLVHRQFQEPDTRLAWLILLASLPAAAAGILFKSLVERAFNNPSASAGFLLITAILLVLGDALWRRRTHSDFAGASSRSKEPQELEGQESSAGGDQQRSLDALTPRAALLVGFAQALALFPGISRSGATISAGLSRGMARAEAARFSFLMAVPIMLGAGIVALLDLLAIPQSITQLPSLAVGFLAAAVVGALAIRWLMRFIATRSLIVFSIYCAVIGAAGLLLSALRG